MERHILFNDSVNDEAIAFIHFTELCALLHDVGKLSSAFLKYRKEWHSKTKGFDEDPHDHGFWCGEGDEFKSPDPLLNKPDFSILKKFGCKTFPFRWDDKTKPGNSLVANLSIQLAVNSHVGEQSDDLMRMLKAADGVDSAQDRNNPLWSAEQCFRDKPDSEQNKIVFGSTPFGNERRIDFEELEEKRKILYEKLQTTLENPEENKILKPQEIGKLRNELVRIIKEAFECGLSDTTRPQNDTTLWDHAYGVASLLKVLLNHYFLYNEKIRKFPEVRFQILCIGWSSAHYLGKSVKLGDLIGRQKCLNDLQKYIIKLVEYEQAFGNHVYKDNDGVYFLIPVDKKIVREGKECRPVQIICDALKNEVQKKANELCHYELQPRFTFLSSDDASAEQGTRFITHIVQVIEKNRVETSAPFTNEADIPLPGTTKHADTCPVCRIRPQTDPVLKLCDKCKKTRTGASANYNNKHFKPFLHSQIADTNGRLALLSVRLHLKPWLNGRFIRTLFVTEGYLAGQEMADLGNTKQFEDFEKELKKMLEKTPFEIDGDSTPSYSYNQLMDALKIVREGSNDCRLPLGLLFLYRNAEYMKKEEAEKSFKSSVALLDDQLNAMKTEQPDRVHLDDDALLLNALCAKTPTPSTILSVWHSTNRFLNELHMTVEETIEQSYRIVFDLGEDVSPFSTGIIYRGFVASSESSGQQGQSILFYLPDNGSRVELVIPLKSKERADWEKLKGHAIYDIRQEGSKETITAQPVIKDISFEPYHPIRGIIEVPNDLLMIIPARQVPAVVRRIHAEYAKEFSKVQGRLGIGISAVYFRESMPMSVVMDARKRQIDSFEDIWARDIFLNVINHNPESFEAKVSVDSVLHDSYILKISTDITKDYHHPWFIFETGDPKEGQLQESPDYFQTVAGPVVHHEAVREGQSLKWIPNLFDGIYLDASSRRFEAYGKELHSRIHPLTGEKGAGPMFLERFLQQYRRCAEMIEKSPELTVTKINQIVRMLLEKKRLWQKDHALFKKFVKDIVAVEFSHLDANERTLFENMVKNGVFFDVFYHVHTLCKEKTFQILT